MSSHAGARLMRLQPSLVHPSLRHRTSCASALSLRIAPLHPNAHASRAATRGFLHRNNALKLHAREASTSSAAQTTKPSDSPNNDPSTSSQSPSSPEVPATISDPLNPPASTRPPPLDLPVRDPDTRLVTHLFRLGKAYSTFYKTGIKAVFTNRRLLRDLPDTPPPHLPSPITSTRGASSSSSSSSSSSTTSQSTIAATAPAPSSSSSPSTFLPSHSLDKSANPTRSSLLLRARVRHDTARLPLFGVIVLICGEFTPLIVLLFPRLTPYTCRIPTQATVIRRGIESRRAASFRSLQYVDSSSPTALLKVADGHICRSLGLGSALWDKTGFDVPFAKARAVEVVRRIVQDDALLRDGGGAEKLVDDEVVLACEERGIDTLGKDVSELRQKLAEWLVESAPNESGDADAMMKEATGKVRGLLLGLDKPI